MPSKTGYISSQNPISETSLEGNPHMNTVKRDFIPTSVKHYKETNPMVVNQYQLESIKQQHEESKNQ